MRWDARRCIEFLFLVIRTGTPTRLREEELWEKCQLCHPQYYGDKKKHLNLFLLQLLDWKKKNRKGRALRRVPAKLSPAFTRKMRKTKEEKETQPPFEYYHREEGKKSAGSRACALHDTGASRGGMIKEEEGQRHYTPYKSAPYKVQDVNLSLWIIFISSSSASQRSCGLVMKLFLTFVKSSCGVWRAIRKRSRNQFKGE